MNKVIVGILDYGAGNTASVRSVISKLNYRSRLIKKKEDLSQVDLLVIPGVGAFPSAMSSLKELSLIEPIREFVHSGKGVVGVCLGMQLLADISYENGSTAGLGLIPGEVKPLVQPAWHIGWNTLEVASKDGPVSLSDGESFYFNHAYEFKVPEKYIVAISRLDREVTSVVQKNNVYGFQFHPEKSQRAGMKLIKNTMEALLHA